MNQESKKQELVITRIFDLPVELVWKAWTDPELVMKWWGPEHFTSPSCKIDLREGGRYLFCMRSPENLGGQDSFSTGTYTKIIPQERLEFTHHLCDKDGNILDPVEAGMPSDFPYKIDYIIDFKAEENKTELVITQYGWSPGEMQKRAITGMNQSLDKLAVTIGAMYQSKGS
ncbi:SRPBCC family protein [Salibacterium sp. K-3]